MHPRQEVADIMGYGVCQALYSECFLFRLLLVVTVAMRGRWRSPYFWNDDIDVTRGSLFPLSRAKALCLEVSVPHLSKAPWQKVGDKPLDP